MIEIKPANPQDAPVLAELEAACFDEPWSLSSLESSLEDEKFCLRIAWEGAVACGYVLGWSIAPEAELARIAVEKKHRGLGIGESLMREILLEFKRRDVREMFLEVRPSNESAIRLYRRCGFEIVGERQNYCSNGENALVMRLDL